MQRRTLFLDQLSNPGRGHTRKVSFISIAAIQKSKISELLEIKLMLRVSTTEDQSLRTLSENININHYNIVNSRTTSINSKY